MPELRIRPVHGIGDVQPGDDLADLIVAAAPWIADGDVLVVTSKIVSKAEGRLVEVPPSGPERDAARDAVLAAETARPVATRGSTRIVQTHHGFVMAAAGIDASNVDSTRLVLLPLDPDASARRIRADLEQRHGKRVAVIVSDTMGRPWRLGLVDVALGASGIEALRDHRGDVDPYGNELHLTQMAVIDELAAAAELVKGKTDRVPVAVVSGLVYRDGGGGARDLLRGAEQDLFSLGTAEARIEGLRASIPDATGFGDADVDLSTVDLSDVVRLGDGPARDKLRALLPPGAAEVVVTLAPSAEPWAIAQAGAAVHRLRAAVAAAGLASVWVPVSEASIVDVVALPAGAVPLGLVGIGAPA